MGDRKGFLAGAGAMGALVRGHDWAATPLGAIECWPASLRTAVDMILGSGHAMCLIWGPERILIYNAAYAPILGARHPAALGRPTAEVWPELWDDIRPLIDRAFAGEAIVIRDQPLTMTRHGYAEETWYSYAYSPVHGEDGEVAGMLNITSDSTDRMLALRGRDEAFEEMRAREAFTASVLASSTDCIKVLDLDGRLTFMSEGGQKVMEVSDFNAVAGCPWPDFWQAAGNDEARAAIAAARRGEAHSFVGKADTFAGTPKWWHVAVSPIAGEDGRPDRILSVSRDVTELRASEEERDRFVRLAESSSDFVDMMYPDGRVFYMNPAGRQLIGLEGDDLSGLTMAAFVPDDQQDRITREVLPTADAEGHWEGELCFCHLGTGERIPVLSSVFPITDTDGTPIGYASTTRDYRTKKAAEEQLLLLNGELSHRLKNTLGVVQAIAMQTLGGGDPALMSAFSERLNALSAAHDVLLRKNWSTASLREVAAGVLAIFDAADRVSIEGPDLTIGPRATLALSLLLHELATNATKYGALSVPEGTVSLSWQADGDADDRPVVMRWVERGGPPATAPTRRGFGSRIIRMGLTGSGGVDLRYEPVGLTAEMTATLDQLQQA